MSLQPEEKLIILTSGGPVVVKLDAGDAVLFRYDVKHGGAAYGSKHTFACTSTGSPLVLATFSFAWAITMQASLAAAICMPLRQRHLGTNAARSTLARSIVGSHMGI